MSGNDEIEKKSESKFFWKGKRVSEKVYKHRFTLQEVGKNLRKVYGMKNIAANLKNDGNSQYVERALEGRRIIHVKTLADEVFCKKCESILSVNNTIQEKHYGLASVYYTRFRTCKRISRVATDIQHKVLNQSLHYDGNTKVVVGALNAGIGNTHLNKVFASLNIPQFNWRSYKVCEKEVGQAVEKIAYESCLKAANEERQQTIERVEELKMLLPDDVSNNFIFPDLPNLNESTTILLKNKVRIAASFDMGWSTRGTGKTYDSLSGTAALIGYFSKKVISYVSLNRKCIKCDRGHQKDDHNCRLNFEGSAKAMEPKAVVELTKQNTLLTKCNIELGIMIADNDSSAISGARSANNYQIFKRIDTNHTSKGLVNELYKLKKQYNELSVSTIKYLQKCFNYSVSQNKGDCKGMAEVIKNIPYHSFNNHKNCGAWCTYSKNPQSYKHANIANGFTDLNSFEAFKCLFNVMASNTNRFAAGASSNSNESLNAMIRSKAPKSRLYSISAAGDIRVACAINKKNEGEKYIANLNAAL